MIFQLHTNAPIVDLVPIAIVLVPGDRTNVRSPFLAVLDGIDLRDEHMALLDHAHHPEGDLLHQDVQVGPCPSPFVQLPHDIEKYNIEDLKFINDPNLVISQPIFSRQCGTTTHNNHHILHIPSHILTTMINTPQTSGNPGTNGKITPSLPIHPTLLVGSSTPNHQPQITSLMTPQLNQSLHSPPTTTRPITNHESVHSDQGRFNLVALLLFLRDVLPSISKTAQEKSGLEISNLL
jgi:hypothetical protein